MHILFVLEAGIIKRQMVVLVRNIGSFVFTGMVLVSKALC